MTNFGNDVFDWVSKLFSPLNYLRIQHEKKRTYDFYIPILLAVISTWAVCKLIPDIALLGNDGLINSVTGLIQILVGFYIAALAAVATFQNPTIDSPMAGTPPTLKRKLEYTSETFNLSRREFVCFLFGYLAFISLVLFIIGLAAKFGGRIFIENLPTMITGPVKAASLFLFFGIFWNIIVTTLLGLFYLTDRIHRE